MALPFGEGPAGGVGGWASRGFGGCEAAPHLNLLPWGEEVRLPGPAHRITATTQGRVPSFSFPQRGKGLRRSPSGRGRRGRGGMGFEGLWWLRGGPSSQSSPVGRPLRSSGPGPRGRSGRAIRESPLRERWIPAFAGMTGVGGLRKGLRWERGRLLRPAPRACGAVYPAGFIVRNPSSSAARSRGGAAQVNTGGSGAAGRSARQPASCSASSARSA